MQNDLRLLRKDGYARLSAIITMWNNTGFHERPASEYPEIDAIDQLIDELKARLGAIQ